MTKNAYLCNYAYLKYICAVSLIHVCILSVVLRKFLLRLRNGF